MRLVEQDRMNSKVLESEVLRDVVIVGGGPAGLSAALLLGRCLRKVVVCDAGEQRNRVSKAMHAFLGSDGVNPIEFLERAQGQIRHYDSVEFREIRVVDVLRKGTHFVVHLEDGAHIETRGILLATGLRDSLPDLPGFSSFYGTSVHQCPYCDGWEHRGQKIGVMGSGRRAVDLAMELLIWSPCVTLYAHCEENRYSEHTSEQLKRLGIACVVGRIRSLEGHDALEKVNLDNGDTHLCDALFFSPEQTQHSRLALRMGLSVDPDSGALIASSDGGMGLQGIYAAGNASVVRPTDSEL